MHPAACLSAEDLAAFAEGRLPGPVLESAARHLEACPDCQRRLEARDGAPNPIVEALRRSPPPTAALPGAQAVVERLLRQSALTPWPAPFPTEPPRQVGDYQILGQLGRGGMGIVYQARQVSLGRLVALKMLASGPLTEPEDRVRILREAEAVARLRHPHLVQIHEIGTWEGRPFLALEYVEGGSLAAAVQGQPQPPRRAAELVECVARAIHHAHRLGVIHRDLKPANILLTADGQPKVADFGLARRFDVDSGLTGSGVAVGTPSYMAPEQVAGRSKGIGPPADVYALGAVLYELLTGRPVFLGETPLATMEQVVRQEPVPPRRLVATVPADLQTICVKCLAKEPARRYATAEALADDLRRFCDGRPIVARPVGPLERAAKWARRRPAVAALLVALTLVSAAAGGLVTWKWREADRRATAEQQARRQAETLLADSFLDEGINLCERDQAGSGLCWLARALELAHRLGDADRERVARINLTAWRARVVRKRAELLHKDWVWAVAFSRDGRVAVTVSKDRTARL
jgi:hypothetical protein